MIVFRMQMRLGKGSRTRSASFPKCPERKRMPKVSSYEDQNKHVRYGRKTSTCPNDIKRLLETEQYLVGTYKGAKQQ